MKRSLAIFILVAGCQQNPPDAKMDLKPPPDGKADLKTLSGVVIEKRANVKSYEAWNAPSDPYYVLDMDKADEHYARHMPEGFQANKCQIALRPSKVVTTETLGAFKDKRAILTAKYTDGEWYKPTGPDECYPIELDAIARTDEAIQEGPMRPARRGRGYIVFSIVKQEE